MLLLKMAVCVMVAAVLSGCAASTQLTPAQAAECREAVVRWMAEKTENRPAGADGDYAVIAAVIVGRYFPGAFAERREREP